MLKRHLLERQRRQIVQRQRIHGLRFLRNLQNAFVHVERRLGLPIDVDDVSELLKGTEDEEGIDPQREKLANRDRAREDQIEHQEQDARAEEVHGGALNETEAAQVFHLL